MQLLTRIFLAASVILWATANSPCSWALGAASLTVTALASPVAHWKLDETAGTVAANSSGNGNTGSLVNGPLWTTGKVGNALSFDGVNDYLTVPHNSKLSVMLRVSESDATFWFQNSSLFRKY